MISKGIKTKHGVITLLIDEPKEKKRSDYAYSSGYAAGCRDNINASKLKKSVFRNDNSIEKHGSLDNSAFVSKMDTFGKKRNELMLYLNDFVYDLQVEDSRKLLDQAIEFNNQGNRAALKEVWNEYMLLGKKLSDNRTVIKQIDLRLDFIKRREEEFDTMVNKEYTKYFKYLHKLRRDGKV